jgi:hypothetical protein
MSDLKIEEIFEDSGNCELKENKSNEFYFKNSLQGNSEEICSDEIQPEKSFEIFNGKIFSTFEKSIFSTNALKARLSYLYSEYDEIKNQLDQLIKVISVTIARIL